MSEDADLLRRWAAGDAEAGETLYRAHFRDVYRFLRSKCGDAVDDLVQDTFLVAVRRQPAYRGGSMRAFLLGIARYELLEWVRQQAKRAERIDPVRESLRDLNCGPSTALRTSDSRKQVQEALTDLSFDLQTAIELFYWHGLSTKEIAEVQGVEPATIRTRLHRARSSLKEHFDAELLSSVGVDERSYERPASGLH